MSSDSAPPRRTWPIWKTVISALPVGIGVALFLTIRWPWDIVIVVVLMGLAVLLARLANEDFPAAVAKMLLLYAALFVIVLTGVGVYLTSSVRQQWLPVPVLLSIGVIGLLLAGSWVLLNGRSALDKP